jgi:hypothetical protein
MLLSIIFAYLQTEVPAMMINEENGLILIFYVVTALSSPLSIALPSRELGIRRRLSLLAPLLSNEPLQMMFKTRGRLHGGGSEREPHGVHPFLPSWLLQEGLLIMIWNQTEHLM